MISLKLHSLSTPKSHLNLLQFIAHIGLQADPETELPHLATQVYNSSCSTLLHQHASTLFQKDHLQERKCSGFSIHSWVSAKTTNKITSYGYGFIMWTSVQKYLTKASSSYVTGPSTIKSLHLLFTTNLGKSRPVI